MIVTASNPLSCKTKFEAAKMVSKVTNSTGTFIYSGTHQRRNAVAMPQPDSTPKTVAKAMPDTKTNMACSTVPTSRDTNTYSNAKTAASAPMGSFTMASHCNNAAGRWDNLA